MLLMAATVKSKRFRAAVSGANRSGVSQVHHGCLIAATGVVLLFVDMFSGGNTRQISNCEVTLMAREWLPYEKKNFAALKAAIAPTNILCSNNFNC
jgi:hypothetical protein